MHFPDSRRPYATPCELRTNLPSGRRIPLYYHIFKKYIFISKIIFQPNTYSPANVDASVAFRNWKEGKDNKYKEIIAKQVCFNSYECLEFFPFF